MRAFKCKERAREFVSPREGFESRPGSERRSCDQKRKLTYNPQRKAQLTPHRAFGLYFSFLWLKGRPNSNSFNSLCRNRCGRRRHGCLTFFLRKGRWLGCYSPDPFPSSAVAALPFPGTRSHLPPKLENISQRAAGYHLDAFRYHVNLLF